MKSHHLSKNRIFFFFIVQARCGGNRDKGGKFARTHAYTFPKVSFIGQLDVTLVFFMKVLRCLLFPKIAIQVNDNLYCQKINSKYGLLFYFVAQIGLPEKTTSRPFWVQSQKTFCWTCSCTKIGIFFSVLPPQKGLRNFTWPPKAL